MNPTDIQEQVYAIAATCLDVDRSEVNAETNSKTTPEWDSLAHLMIIDALEAAFCVKLQRQAAYSARNLGDLAGLVAAARSRAP